jgi:hypothetical protein
MKLVGAKELRPVPSVVEGTDELSVYDNVVEDGSRAICLAHWLKSKCKRAYDLSRQARPKDCFMSRRRCWSSSSYCMTGWPSPTVPAEIERLVRRFISCRRGTLWKINQLLQHIERSWPYVGRIGPDPTNNATERAIGLTYKIRDKTMRGFKSRQKALAHSYLSEFLRGEHGVCDLRKVIWQSYHRRYSWHKVFSHNLWDNYEKGKLVMTHFFHTFSNAVKK